MMYDCTVMARKNNFDLNIILKYSHNTPIFSKIWTFPKIKHLHLFKRERGGDRERYWSARGKVRHLLEFKSPEESIPLQTALKNRVPACSRPHYDCRMEPNGIQMHLSHRLCFQHFLVPLRLDRDPNRYFSTRLIWHFRSSLFIGPGVHTQIIAFWIGSYWECAGSDWGLPPSVGSLIVFLIGHHEVFQHIPQPKKYREKLGTRQ